MQGPTGDAGAQGEAGAGDPPGAAPGGVAGLEHARHEALRRDVALGTHGAAVADLYRGHALPGQHDERLEHVLRLEAGDDAPGPGLLRPDPVALTAGDDAHVTGEA